MGKEMVSSTGTLGAEPRDHGRYYVNSKSYVADPEVFMNRAKQVRRVINARGYERTVFRGVVGSHVNDRLRESDMQPFVEVVVPIGEFTGDDSWLVSLANNAPRRRSTHVPKETMIAEIRQRDAIKSPVERVRRLVDEGFAFSDRIESHEMPQIATLLGTTFGWENKGIEELQKKLLAGRLINPSDRSVWISTLKNPYGAVVGFSQAERLSRPVANGRWIDMVESTEWSIHPDYEGNGYMPAILNMLNAQVFSDLQMSPNYGPFIYAECNFASRADFAGAAAGFRVPDRDHASQILVQNVPVGDRRVLPSSLRDFTFMYVTQDMIDKHYSPDQVANMVKLIH